MPSTEQSPNRYSQDIGGLLTSLHHRINVIDQQAHSLRTAEARSEALIRKGMTLIRFPGILAEFEAEGMDIPQEVRGAVVELSYRAERCIASGNLMGLGIIESGINPDAETYSPTALEMLASRYSGPVPPVSSLN